MSEPLPILRLLQLADSAVPIGGAAHSFGLESLVGEELLDAGSAPEFFRCYLEESGLLDACFCRASHARSEPWLALNRQVAALKPARESRMASATLGRRFLQLAASLSADSALSEALSESAEDGGEVHLSTAFGLAGARIGVDAITTGVALLHQSIGAMISALQRLLPLGQSAAAAMLWRLKPLIVETVERSMLLSHRDAPCFAGGLDLASMRHAHLGTRLFIS